MAIIKCKMCGGDLRIGAGATVAECEYCGTRQTLPKLDDDRKANLYDRANHFRRNNEFDKAMGIYEQLLNEDGTDAEAYWSLVLCRYGIEYVEDPKTHKRIPTVNRVQFTAVFDDDNYQSALQYADSFQRQLYEAEAKAINEIQKEILAISQKEEPFDVFICYKETDNNGRRTPDSVLATELYHQLVREGFKVFFSRITLEDKLGTAYEPYIFAALNSAKVMVVLGTRPEYFQAVWVKNEWSRYLSLIRQGQPKILIPAYRDMDPYDLPEEFSHLQAQDMSKLGFMQDLLYGIKKLVRAAVPQSAAVKETVIAGGVNTEALLKRAFMFLEDGNWAGADEYCEKVLDADPECAKAYLGKLMAQQQVKKQEHLESAPTLLEDNSYYQKAVRFADDELRQTLTVVARKNAERVEEVRKDRILANAKAAAAWGTAEHCREAIALLETIPGWEDADAVLDNCRQDLEQLVAEEQDNAKRRKKRLPIILSAVAGVIVIILVLRMCTGPGSSYKKAVRLMENGNYDEAMIAFRELGEYEDSADMIKECRYLQALELMEAGAYQDAADGFDSLGDYEDSAVQLEVCSYEIAQALLEEGKYDEAEAVFNTIRDYEDSADLVKECRYQKALVMMDEGNFAGAETAFADLKDYKDSKAQIMECAYRVALAAMEEGAYDVALRQFEELGVYKDSADQLEECQYQQALALIDEEKYEEALEILTSLEAYKDSTDMIKECRYQQAMQLLASGDIMGGYDAFIALGDYKDSADQAESVSTIYERLKGKSELFTQGQWWDDTSQRCNLYMEIINEDTINITIEWTYDAWTIAYWEMRGEWDISTGTLNYSNCEHYLVGGSGEKDYTYYRGSGCFYFVDGWLFWEDYEYDAGKDCRFYSWTGI